MSKYNANNELMLTVAIAVRVSLVCLASPILHKGVANILHNKDHRIFCVWGGGGVRG